MNSKHYLIISGIIGGVIGSLFTALLVSPVTAQRDEIGEIECTKLTVIDEAGKVIASLEGNPFGGQLNMYNKNNGDTHVEVAAGPAEKLGGGGISVMGGEGAVHINTSLGGNIVLHSSYEKGLHTYLNAGEIQITKFQAKREVDDDEKTKFIGVNQGGEVRMDIDDDGGFFLVADKDGKLELMLRGDEHGGRVAVYSKSEKTSAILGIDENGGRVDVLGKGEGKAAIGINEYGNGAISIWDNNGYRQ